MKQLLPDELMRDSARSYVAEIEVPPYDETRVRRRLTAPIRSQPNLRRMATVFGTFIVLAILALNARSVVAQVERVFRAFAIVDGQAVPVPVTNVTLAQARQDMPFEVIEPRMIPAGFTPRIVEFGSTDNGRVPAHVMFQYSATEGLPGVSIDESRYVPGEPSQRMQFMMTYSSRPGMAPPVPPALPQGQSGTHAIGDVRYGSVQRRVKLQPITWVVRGTRITLIVTPGTLNTRQLAAIQRAMR